MVEEKPIGKIVHFFPKICVAVVSLTDGSLKVGDKIRVVKGEESFEQTVGSMQVEHEQVKVAKKGQEFGLKLDKEVHVGALVYKSKM